MADDASDYMYRMHQVQPDKPIFIKYAPGATHAPHHPTELRTSVAVPRHRRWDQRPIAVSIQGALFF
jgi:hypothetical protein